MSGCVLLTCAGRRTSLLRAFREAAHARGIRVLAADSNSLAPALYLADGGVRLPRLDDAAYLSELLEVIERERVRLVVPTIDTELPILARHAERIAAKGCVALVSSPRMIELAADKWLTVSAYSKAGIRSTRSWLPDQYEMSELPEELFLKPRDGSASQHSYAVRREHLPAMLPLVPNAIIQERLEGPEITIDALLDPQGRPIHCVPRRRIRTVGGESIEGVTMDNAELRPWLLQVLQASAEMGGRGPVTLQAFLTPSGPVFSEINPRFGGGFPLTQAAGGRYPEWILRSLEGEKLAPCFGEYRKGLYMTRYYVEHFLTEPLWK